jgi:hypothetical protein
VIWPEFADRVLESEHRIIGANLAASRALQLLEMSEHGFKPGICLLAPFVGC